MTRHPLCISELSNNSEAVTSVAFDPTGTFIASCSNDGTARLFYFDSITTNDHKHFRIKLEGDTPTKCCFTHDGSHLVVSTRDNKELYAIKILRKKNEEGRSYEIKLKYPGKHKADIQSLQVSHNSQFIVTCYNDTKVLLWNFKADVVGEINTKQMKNTMACISADSKFIAVATFMSEVKVWALKYAQPAAGAGPNATGSFRGLDENPFTLLKGHTSGVTSVSFLSDNKRAVTCSKDGTWKLWKMDVDYKRDTHPPVLATGKNPVSGEYSLHAVSPDCRVLVVVCGIRDVQIWDLEATKLVENITGSHGGTILSLDWSADSKLFATASSDCSIRVFKNPLLQ